MYIISNIRIKNILSILLCILLNIILWKPIYCRDIYIKNDNNAYSLFKGITENYDFFLNESELNFYMEAGSYKLNNKNQFLFSVYYNTTFYGNSYQKTIFDLNEYIDEIFEINFIRKTTYIEFNNIIFKNYSRFNNVKNNNGKNSIILTSLIPQNSIYIINSEFSEIFADDLPLFLINSSEFL
ncbi:hypothetical protein U3516DRAFT_661896 [Neocallimastix sp. 'constans']